MSNFKLYILQIIKKKLNCIAFIATFVVLITSCSATATDFNYNTVKSEIQANRPVILSGYSDKSGFIFHTFKGGHVWVADGARGGTSCGEQNPDGTWTGGASFLYFHMNWGVGRIKQWMVWVR